MKVPKTGIERITLDNNIHVGPSLLNNPNEAPVVFSGSSVPSELKKLFRKILKGTHPDLDLSQIELDPVLPVEYFQVLAEIEGVFVNHLNGEQGGDQESQQSQLSPEEKKMLTRGIQVIQESRSNQKIINILRGLLLKS